MATTTPNYGWPVPTDTDYVKDGAAAIEALGDAIDATVFGLPSGALTLISTTTIGTAVSSVTVSGAFSADYDNYKIVVSGGSNNANNGAFTLSLGGSTTQYYYGLTYAAYTGGSVLRLNGNNAASWLYVGNANTDGLSMDLNLNNPFLTKQTWFSAGYADLNNNGINTGFLNNNNSHTAFTLTGGTFTGGSICVYGYQK
jgi:hypothetical protein